MWHWSKLSSVKWLDAWEERFYGNPNSVINEIKGGKSIRVEVYCETQKEADVIQEQFGGSVRSVKEQNWVALSEVARPPLKIRDALLITGARETQAVKDLQSEYPNRTVVRMPAEMAFGTGDHATTSTCLRFLVDISRERKKSQWDMLDLGCGTAILAIAARVLGAESCEAHDFDPQAVRVSEQNLVLNKVDKIKVLQQDVLEWEPPKQWDVVVANLFSTILQQAFGVIAASLKDDGDLVVSGILFEQWEETKAAAEAQGLKFSKVIRKGKWVSARGHK
ncbi:50S ribosomal protein L11 methyltransferase [Rubritalea sp.]|uniref:50S ribosomal protein L11 methyltransferase n=1 Tax=Rubritalea sp. TaxID=2109375 RepID=UPI003EF1D905